MYELYRLADLRLNKLLDEAKVERLVKEIRQNKID